MNTYAQYSIKHCLDMLAPFESTDMEIQNAQWQFYQFMTSIYRGMYEDQEKYMVFSEQYEKYIQKRQIIKKEKEHSTDSRESTLRNTFQQAIQFYALYFYHLGLCSNGINEDSGSLIISNKDYFDVLNHMNRIHQSHYNAKRYEVLADMGIEVREREDTIEISHKTYKQMMSGLLYLCEAPDGKYKLMNYLRLDFKNAYAPIPTVADICKTLPSQNAEIVKMLEEHLSGMKVKTKIRPLRGMVLFRISDGRSNILIREKTYVVFMLIMNILCYAFILMTSKISMHFQRYYLKKIENNLNGLKISLLRGFVNVQATAE